MNLLETLKAVREENLTKTQLEAYHTILSGLYGDIQIEIAELKKAKAIFFVEYDKENATPDVKIKRIWDASEKGQRLMTLESYAKATRTQLQSLKSRLYSSYV